MGAARFSPSDVSQLHRGVEQKIGGFETFRKILSNTSKYIKIPKHLKPRAISVWFTASRPSSRLSLYRGRFLSQQSGEPRLKAQTNVDCK